MNGIRHASGASVQVLKSEDDAVETMVELRGYPHQLTMVSKVYHLLTCTGNVPFDMYQYCVGVNILS